MSHFEIRFVNRSQKNRRCVGCSNCTTILKGHSYYSCWYASGSDSGRYAICVPCYEHLYGTAETKPCKYCQEQMRDDDEYPDVRECIIQTEEYNLKIQSINKIEDEKKKLLENSITITDKILDNIQKEYHEEVV